MAGKFRVTNTRIFFPFLPGIQILIFVFMLLAGGTYSHAAAIIVTNNSDSGAGSLRQAILDAAAGDTIIFAGDFTITLAGELSISKSMTIDGGTNKVTVSGNNAVRVFYVGPGVAFNLQNLTVAGGRADNGGGIYNAGTLTMTNSTFSGNYASAHGGGIFNNGGTVSVSNSTFSGNSADTGGGLYNSAGTLTMTNCIFSGNSASDSGGGINNNGNGTLTMSNSAFSGNTSTFGGGVFNFGTLTVINSTLSGNSASDSGGSIYNAGTLTVTNSIIAAGTTGGNCSGDGFSGSSNLADDDTCGSSFINSSSINLGTLGNYGGPTQTIPLLAGSAAIDAGDDSTCPSTDQRGRTRPQGTKCDIGAYELDATAPETTIIANPSNPGGGNALFEFIGSDPPGIDVSHFECQLDGGSWDACASPKSYTDLYEGIHIFQVRSIDLDNNTDQTPASYGWIVAGSTTSSVDGGGGHGGGGGGGGSASTTTTSVPVTTTTTVPAPAPECATAADCDDGVFCNGAEQCVDGACTAGDAACGPDELCVEDEGQCWTEQTLEALSLQRQVARPMLLEQRCQWLVIRPQGEYHFTRDSGSRITFSGPEENAEGIAIDSKRTAFDRWGFILVPVCVERDATAGQWQLKITTPVADAVAPHNEIIEYSFEIK